MHLEVKCYFLDHWLKVSKNLFFPRENLISLLVYKTSGSGAALLGVTLPSQQGPLPLLLVPEALLQSPDPRRTHFTLCWVPSKRCLGGLWLCSVPGHAHRAVLELEPQPRPFSRWETSNPREAAWPLTPHTSSYWWRGNSSVLAASAPGNLGHLGQGASPRALTRALLYPVATRLLETGPPYKLLTFK